jgi:hypothetical protein
MGEARTTISEVREFVDTAKAQELPTEFRGVSGGRAQEIDIEF